MVGKLIKTQTGFYLWRNPLDKSQEILGASVPIMGDNGVDLREYKLSLKNCQAIENGYDLDELAEKKRIELGRTNKFTSGFIEGAKAILEILGDNSLLKESRDLLVMCSLIDKSGQCNDMVEKIDQSLQQTEWDVEIEMDTSFMWQFPEPKLDADGCIILKRK